MQTLDIDDKQLIRVGGLLKENSLRLENTVWYFDIIDEQEISVAVIFEKTLPNLVEENKGIIVEGIYKNNFLIANTVLAKHDENYMPQSTIDKMKSEGIWRGD